jgi:hypothetical protein
MDTKILKELEAAYSEELNLVAGDLGALEAAVKTKMEQLGQGLLQRLVKRQSNGYKDSSISCNCGGSKCFVGHPAKDFNTIFGWIKIRRTYYHCQHCGGSLVPYDIAGAFSVHARSCRPARNGPKDFTIVVSRKEGSIILSATRLLWQEVFHYPNHLASAGTWAKNNTVASRVYSWKQ